MANRITSPTDSAIGTRDGDARARRPTVFYVQPLIARYRMEVVESLNRLFNVTVFARSKGVEASGFSRELPACNEFVETRIDGLSSHGMQMQSHVLMRMLRDRPDAVLIFADVRYLSLWLALAAGRLTGVPVLLHGQGLYRHRPAGIVRAICYRLAVALATRYVCYTDASRASLERIGCPGEKLVVANNSLTVTDDVEPSAKSGAEDGVLFIGRLREGSQVEQLIDAVGKLREEGHRIALHVVGGGERAEWLRREYGARDYVTWYGAVFDDREIAAISRRCRVGCYPGAAGLSIVHMFALSLPPVVHDRLALHMGPEPAYIEHGRTGFVFARERGADGLAATLRQVWAMPPDAMRAAAAAAYATYRELNSPSLGSQLAEIVRAAVRA